MSRYKFIFTILVLIIGLVLAGGFFYYQKISEVNYLIEDVPYFGFYNAYFDGIDITSVPAATSILRYWGDYRLDIREVNTKISPVGFSSNEIPDLTLALEKFFQEQGYKTFLRTSIEKDEIEIIKKFVNAEEKIPVIIFQRRSPEEPYISTGYRVVIGISDSQKKIVVHDFDHGNNYEISYKDLEKMFDRSGRRTILAAWPGANAENLVPQENIQLDYSERLEAMDKVGPMLATKRADARTYHAVFRDYEKAASNFETTIQDPAFQDLPPAFRVSTMCYLASAYKNLEKFDEAIALVKEKMIPLNKKLNEVPDGWFGPAMSQLLCPYYNLSMAYLGKGQKNLAIEAYKEYMKVREQGIRETGRQNLEQYKIAELEEEIIANQKTQQ